MRLPFPLEEWNGLAPLFAALTLVGCQALPSLQAPGPSGPAQLSVQVHRGFAVPDTPLGDPPTPVEVLVDARGGSGGRSLGHASAFVDALPPGSLTRARLVGHATAEGCDEGLRLEPRTGQDLAAQLQRASSGGSGSLAAALRGVAVEPRSARSSERLVVFSAALEDACSDLCVAAQQLSTRGLWIDWVVPPEVAVPSCLAGLRPRIEGPGPLVGRLSPSEPSFQVRIGHAPDGDALAAGRSGDTVSVIPGDVTVWLDVSPPEIIGPLRLAPGEVASVHVLDFPMREPPLRTWWLERGTP